MGTDETNIDDSSVKVNLHDQPIVIALDVEYNTITRQDVSSWVALKDVLRRAPFRIIGFGVPRLDSIFHSAMLYPKLFKRPD